MTAAAATGAVVRRTGAPPAAPPAAAADLPEPEAASARVDIPYANPAWRIVGNRRSAKPNGGGALTALTAALALAAVLGAGWHVHRAGWLDFGTLVVEVTDLPNGTVAEMTPAETSAAPQSTVQRAAPAGTRMPDLLGRPYRLTMETFKYFAYGSNMLTERLTDRCPTAQAIGIANAAGYVLEFCKKSRDESGKATLAESSQPGQQVFGVFFEIENGDLCELDKAEGKGNGYDRLDKFSANLLADGTQYRVKTYIASTSAVEDRLKPYDWYLALVIAGALQHKLPETWIARLHEVAYIADPDSKRTGRVKAEEALKNAGWQDYKQILSPPHIG